ncbi:MAG: gluconate 2-dehydrogenase subunit 3 family protein [Pseudomonadota bacterium]
MDHKNISAHDADIQNSSTTQTTISRRSLLQTGISAGSVSLLPLIATSSCSAPATVSPTVLDENMATTLAAFSNRIVPADANGPAAVDCGVVTYINRSLAEWNQADIPLLTVGLQTLEQTAITRHGKSFAQLTETQQDELMLAMEAGTLENFATAQATFNRLYRLTLEGMFSDPYYGGNVGYAGWDLIGYPGAVLGSTADMQKMGGRLPAIHTSAYGAEHDGH